MPKGNKIGRLVKETAGFSYEFIRHPKKMGSVIPSSRMLARAMRRTAQDYGAPNSIIIEAGAGTGAITRELVVHFPAERLLINELNPRLARRLRDRFPHNTVRRGGVEALEVWNQPARKPSFPRCLSARYRRRLAQKLSAFFSMRCAKTRRTS